jgi:hypothetical protein
LAQIPATQGDLKNAFSKHFHVYKHLAIIDPPYHPMTRRLLLFYAVESGLKYFLLGKIHKRTTDELQGYHEFNYLKEHGHDINNLVKSVGIGDSKNYQMVRFSVPRKWPPIEIEPGELHQIWRYGIEMGVSKYEEQAETILKNIACWLDGKI